MKKIRLKNLPLILGLGLSLVLTSNISHAKNSISVDEHLRKGQSLKYGDTRLSMEHDCKVVLYGKQKSGKRPVLWSYNANSKQCKAGTTLTLKRFGLYLNNMGSPHPLTPIITNGIGLKADSLAVKTNNMAIVDKDSKVLWSVGETPKDEGENGETPKDEGGNDETPKDEGGNDETPKEEGGSNEVTTILKENRGNILATIGYQQTLLLKNGSMSFKNDNSLSLYKTKSDRCNVHESRGAIDTIKFSNKVKFIEIRSNGEIRLLGISNKPISTMRDKMFVTNYKSLNLSNTIPAKN